MCENFNFVKNQMTIKVKHLYVEYDVVQTLS